MGLRNPIAFGIRIVRYISTDVSKESSSIPGLGEDPLRAIVAAKSREAISRVASTLLGTVVSDSTKSLAAIGSLEPSDLGPSFDEYGKGSRSPIFPSSQPSPQYNDIYTVVDRNSVWCAAIGNVIRQRCTDVTVWSFLYDQLDKPPPASVKFDLATAYRVLYDINRFYCNNCVVKAKVDGIVTKLLARVATLARNELGSGVLDLKIQPQKSVLNESLGVASAVVACRGYRHAPDKPLDYKEVWKLWYLLNTSRTVHDSDASQLLLEVLDLHKRKINTFDLGRALRTMSVILQRGTSFSLVEERLLMKLFRRIIKLLNTKPPSAKMSDKLSGADEYYDHSASENQVDASDIHVQELCRPHDKVSDERHGDLALKQGNLYLTVGHIRNLLEVLSVLCKNMPPRTFLPMLSSDTAVSGLFRLFDTAKVVVERSISLKCRLYRSLPAELSREDLRYSDATGNVDLSKSMAVSHVKLLTSAVEFAKYIDLLRYREEEYYVSLSPLRKPLWALCLTHFRSPAPAHLDLNTSQASAGYYLLLSSAVNGECCLDYIHEVVSWTVAILRETLASSVMRTRPLDCIPFLIQVDKLLSLFRDLDVVSPDLIKMDNTISLILQQLDVDSHLFGIGEVSGGKSAVLLLLLQKYDLLSARLLSSFLDGLVGSDVRWLDWDPRNISILCDVVTRSALERSDNLEIDRRGDVLFNDNTVVQTSDSAMLASAERVLRCIKHHLDVESADWSRKFNNDQLLSLVRCHFLVCGIVDCPLEVMLMKRCAVMNLRSCLRCLNLGSDSLAGSALRRITSLLGRRDTPLDITPLLDFLCSSSSVLRPSVEIAIPAFPGEICDGGSVDFVLLERLREALVAADRHLLLLDAVQYLQRRLEKRLHHNIRLYHRVGSIRTDMYVDAPMIALRSSAEGFYATFGILPTNV
ncbi:uncharacterized protein BXIN_0247 [Babesia sp. Xinjiang]|uniref:uncharacterized protein n=1 Tax=Babesia sp. Xinjiang TaxID=462227 RepID=UPI000A262D34|nr:uncharacterized protein BXIN_0247 [Babesia sp. Xinjiang]ORM39613.1 hypothetical protein BXIN_0247 [Babesia sp. Xinjiang]